MNAMDLQVKVFDNDVLIDTVTTNAGGEWTLRITGLSSTDHKLKAILVDKNGPESAEYFFRVLAPLPAFVLDPSDVALSGRLYVPAGRPDVLPTSWPSGTTAARVPSSGVSPYTYSSDNTNVATVDANGMVAARQNGNASITVSDGQGRSGTYRVLVSGVVVCVGFTASRYPQALIALQREGCAMPSFDELRTIYAQYGSQWPQGNDFYWSGTSAGLNKSWVKNLVTGQEGTAVNTSLPGSVCHSTGLR